MHPLDLLEDAVLDFAGKLVHREKLQVDGAAMTIIMPNVRDARRRSGVNAQFLVEFAGQRLLRALARLDLAPGKLPLQRHRLVGTALANQNFAALHDQRGRNKTKGGLGRPGLGVRLAVFHTSSVIALRGCWCDTSLRAVF